MELSATTAPALAQASKHLRPSSQPSGTPCRCGVVLSWRGFGEQVGGVHTGVIMSPVAPRAPPSSTILLHHSGRRSTSAKTRRPIPPGGVVCVVRLAGEPAQAAGWSKPPAAFVPRRGGGTSNDQPGCR